MSLLGDLKLIEDSDGGWNGADTVDTVIDWLKRNGVTDAEINAPAPNDAEENES